jgi:nucleotide-binding universal stress UspA family protein
MYNTILVPLDGSKRAEKILPHVEALAMENGSKVIFLQAIRLLDIVDYEETEMVLYRKEKEQHLGNVKSYLMALKKEFQEKGINAETRISEGSIVKEIIDCAKREDADIIVMTSHGRTGLARAFYGSVAAGVLHLIDRPLLIIRARDGELNG